MHQPAIPEGDEEGDDFGQPMTNRYVAPAHDSALSLQPREDEGIGQIPTIQSEMTAAGGVGMTTSTPQQAEYKTNEEKGLIMPDSQDDAMIPSSESAQTNDVGEQGEGILKGIQEEEGGFDETMVPAILGDQKDEASNVQSELTPDLAMIGATAGVPAEDAPPQDFTEPEVTSDDARHVTISSRERASRNVVPQVEFFDSMEPEEVEEEKKEESRSPRITREEIVSRFQAAEIERDRLRHINLQLQQRLADYLHKRKGTDDLPTITQANERSSAEQQQRYQKHLAEIEALQVKLKRDQNEFESRRSEIESHIETKKIRIDQLKAEYVRMVKEIASKAVFSRSGKTISTQEIEGYLADLKAKEEELIKTRHENIRLKNQLRKRDLQLKSKEELAEGLHMIDFEQLKIENQTYSEKIEERNEELMKLRKKISTTVQILSHIKEKLSFVSEQRIQAAQMLSAKEDEVKNQRDELANTKRKRDRLRQENHQLKQNSGLVGNEALLRDYEDRYDEIERVSEQLENLKKRHAEITLMCKVLKKKISKV